MLNGLPLCTADDCRPFDEKCPFYRPEMDKCQAVAHGFRIEWRRSRNYCSSDQHDDCTLFLGKILRNSRPQAKREALPFQNK